MTKDIMFNNANNLYNLRYQPIFNETPQETPKQIAYKPKPATEPSYQSSGIPPIPPAGATMQPATFGPVDPRSGSPYAPPSFPPPPTVPHVYEDQTLDRFMKQYSDVRFVYVQWLDYTSKTQTRIIPMKEFSRMIREHDRISVSHDSTGIRHNELQTSAGQIYIEPDLRSLRRTNPKDPLPSAAVLSYWRSESGVSLPSCPRTSLESIINTLQYTHATTLLVGFELTVAFLATRATNHDPPIASPPPFPSAILLALDATGIDVLQCHATSAPGEFIFHLAPQPPLLAADTLLQARDTIARMHDGDVSIRTPLMSFALSPATHDEAFFLGGVRAHAPALAAFSSASVSRDAVLRTTPGRWNVAYADGSANMYVALAAVIAAGMLGLQAGEHEFAEQQIGRDAVGALRGDTALREVLGEEIVRSVIEGRESMSEVPRERGIERGFERQGERGYERIDERGYERGVETMRENERVPERRDEIWSEIRHEAERRIPGTDRGFDRPVERRDERMEPNARGAEMAGGRDTSSAERGALSGIDRGMERRDQRWDERTGENERDIRRGAEMGTGRDASGVERGISGIEQGDQRGFERQGDQRERVLPAVGMPLSGAGVQGAGGHDAGIPGAGTQGRGFEARDENPHERERVLPVVGMPPGVGVQGVGGYSVGIPGAVMPVEQLDQRQHERHDERRDQRETRLPNVAREDESSEEDESEDTSEDERPRPGRSVQRDV
jgi:glutamine synthetase